MDQQEKFENKTNGNMNLINPQLSIGGNRATISNTTDGELYSFESGTRLLDNVKIYGVKLIKNDSHEINTSGLQNTFIQYFD
jgi:hypothetical protein